MGKNCDKNVAYFQSARLNRKFDQKRADLPKNASSMRSLSDCSDWDSMGGSILSGMAAVAVMVVLISPAKLLRREFDGCLSVADEALDLCIV